MTKPFIIAGLIFFILFNIIFFLWAYSTSDVRRHERLMRESEGMDPVARTEFLEAE